MSSLCLLAAGMAGLLLFLGGLGAAIEWHVDAREPQDKPWQPCQRGKVVHGDQEPDMWEIWEGRKAS